MLCQGASPAPPPLNGRYTSHKARSAVLLTLQNVLQVLQVNQFKV